MNVAILAFEAFLYGNKNINNKMLPSVRTELGTTAILVNFVKFVKTPNGLVGEQTLKNHAYVCSLLNLQLGIIVDVNLAHSSDNRNISPWVRFIARDMQILFKWLYCRQWLNLNFASPTGRISLIDGHLHISHFLMPIFSAFTHCLRNWHFIWRLILCPC